MDNLEFVGRVAQNPKNLNADRHAYFLVAKKQVPRTRVEQVMHEEVRVRDEDYLMKDYQQGQYDE
jgi:hypothetical protein